MTTRINEATLPANNGVIYHLSVAPENVANNIIVVGDPERVPKIAALVFDKKQDIFRMDHRGLCVMTGTTEDGLRLSVVTHGMGSGSTEIVINEIFALKSIDIKNRVALKEVVEPVNIIRIGTSGALQPTTELGTVVITKVSIGLDNTGLYYDIPVQNEKVLELEKKVTEVINNNINENSRFKGKIHPYCSYPDERMTNAIVKASEKNGIPHKLGITCTMPGFFNCQGRLLFTEMPETVDNIDKALNLEFDGVKTENMEMEISTLTYLCSAFKWIRFGAMCIAIANRRLNTFATDAQGNLDPVVLTAVDALREMNKIPL